MSKSLNIKYSERVIFPFGKQQRFLLMARRKLDIPWSSFADRIKIHKRVLNDWRREEYSMPLDILKRICRISKVKMPIDVKIRDAFWYVSKGARAGGMAVYKKYGRIGGDPEYRKNKWYEWWKKKGKYNTNFINAPRPIKRPFFSQDLAEFVGIILGDGGITQYQVTISFHSVNEKEYSKFVVKLIKKLFNVPIGIYYDKNYLKFDLVISRSELVRFCTEKLGLKKGNKIKQQVDIPDWIKQNKKYSIACVRGLIDTDGCVFTHRYKVNGKWYNYRKLSFKSHSKSLCQSVVNILEENGLNPRLAQKRDVRLDSIEDVQKYFRLIGFNNPKNLKRYKT
ncbi:hypothetical protein COW09_00370 [bacterium (Candidatus Moisslbacteria) CG12_big_fil_rev_8_21_14_0_65_36_11]|nr:MAG: hypothetical protein COS23_00010 [bacterium (Candidatus Moisslbacteria) CG02_land_8_20_14_3_00_36_53]PIW68103.1 MAG: hypothetical protein COW09_00370 [bacterium (Candidatus Moisslbacteria) CG12_big_fil_rev_8_21_14_0_65_36_11]PIZ90284.1 MAG: hypothetical protein COX87_01345 [bacterium (Candidatus Moisslbacteria) CG_4_10_14_0_2_um_filter_36_61]